MTQPQLPDWIAKRPRHLPLIAYHSLNACLTEFKHPQTRIIPREDGLYLHHVEMGSVENLSGYRLATPEDLSTAQFFLSAGGMVFQLSSDGTTVTLNHSEGCRKVKLPSAEDVEFEKVVRGFSRYFDGVIVADEEDTP